MPSESSHAAPVRSGSAVTMTAVLAILGATNLVLNAVVPSGAYIPAILAAAVVGVIAARKGGATLDDLGLAPGRARRSLLVGLGIGGVIATSVFVSLAVPGLRDLFRDDRAAGLSAGDLAYQALVRIPLGTALGEELLFRGVGLGVGLRRWSLAGAIGVSSVLFGLWHILPALDSHSTNSVATGVPMPLLIVATVGITALAGVGLAGLRIRTGHVAAPIVAHAALNAAALIAAAVVSA